MTLVSAHSPVIAVGGRRDGQTFPIDEIMSAKTLYLSSSILSAFTGHTGKAWFEIPLAILSGNFGTSPTGLLQDVQNGNPLTQTEMLAAAKNVRSLGTQVINGVRTTHYAGSFTASARRRLRARRSPRPRTAAVACNDLPCIG